MGEKQNRVNGHSQVPLRTARIPNRTPDRMWAGHGNGTDHCRICGNLLKKEEIAFDLEYDEEGASAPVCYSVHLGCFNAWDVERHKAGGAPANRRPAGPDQSRASLPNPSGIGTISESERETLRTDFWLNPRDPG
jgi:hypothetical protein